MAASLMGRGQSDTPSSAAGRCSSACSTKLEEFQPPHRVCSVAFPWLISSPGVGYLNEYLSLQTTVFEMRYLESYRAVVSHPSWGWVSISERVSLGERPHLAHTLLLQEHSSASERRLVLRSLSAPDKSFYLLVASMCPTTW